MCGIAGSIDRYRSPQEQPLAAMIATLGHRGPEAHAVWSDDLAGLAFARLSIIDLEGGMQPLHSEGGSVHMVCNGEIFNYLGLREQLKARGHVFATGSDCEVVLHLYEELGDRCLDQLNGQFALAIWDRERQRLTLARDRVGIHPLFYTESPGSIQFASEIKALLSLPNVGSTIDLVGLAQAFTYWAPIPPRTMFERIRSLPAGHVLVADREGTRVRRYWTPILGESNEISPADAEHQLLELLRDSVRLRLHADVPVGAYVSGGLDSSFVATLAKQFNPGMRTYSIGFCDENYDETSAQATTVALLGTEHTAFQCAPGQIAEVLPDVVRHAETPLLRTAPAPMFILSALVNKSDLKVVLTGEGADEFFIGYDIFREAKVRAAWARDPDSHVRPEFLRALYADIPGIARLPHDYLKAAFSGDLRTSNAVGFSHDVRWSTTRRLHRFLSSEAKTMVEPAQCEVEARLSTLPDAPDAVGRAQQVEVMTFLEPYLLAAQGDRMLMAHSVEGRFPFLDHRLIAFANSLPTRLKAPGLREKSLLRRAARGLLPDAIRTRPKRPYRAPIRSVFAGARAPEYVRQAFDPVHVRRHGLLDPMRVNWLGRRLRDGSEMGEVDEMAIVGIVTLDLLLEATAGETRN